MKIIIFQCVPYDDQEDEIVQKEFVILKPYSEVFETQYPNMKAPKEFSRQLMVQLYKIKSIEENMEITAAYFLDDCRFTLAVLVDGKRLSNVHCKCQLEDLGELNLIVDTSMGNTYEFRLQA